MNDNLDDLIATSGVYVGTGNISHTYSYSTSFNNTTWYSSSTTVQAKNLKTSTGTPVNPVFITNIKSYFAKFYFHIYNTEPRK